MKELAELPGPHRITARQMYMDLRKNIITTVYNSWRQTGFAWEQYNANTGAGQRTQGFTGWTALVVNILALPELTLAANTDADAGRLGKVEADTMALPAPMYLEKNRYGRGEVGFWLGVVVVVALVLSGLFAFRSWYLKRTGLSGRRAPRYSGL